MTQDGQFELTDFLGKKIASKSVMDLTAWINNQGTVFTDRRGYRRSLQS